jgi:hypothetical protein
MLDDAYILEQSLARMPVDKIIDAYHIARKFRMYLLLEKYATALSERICADTVVCTLEAALGRDRDSCDELTPAFKSSVAPNALACLPEPAPSPSPSPANLSSVHGVHAPASPSASTLSHGSKGAHSIGRKIHVQLTSKCLQFLEKQIEGMFNRRHPVRQAELLMLIHDVLGLVLCS